MKYLLILLLPLNGFAQLDSSTFKIDSAANTIFYDSVITLKGQKDEIFNKEKLWIADILKYPNGPGMAFDKDAGTIILKTTVTILTKYDIVEGKKKKTVTHHQNFYDIELKIKLFSKDGKARMMVTDLGSKNNMYHDFGFWPISYNTLKKASSNINSASIEDQTNAYNDLKMLGGMDNKLKGLITQFVIFMNKKSDTDF